MSDLNVKHFRRIDLRKGLIVGVLTVAEEEEYFLLDCELKAATKPGTVGRGRVDEFIRMSVV